MLFLFSLLACQKTTQTTTLPTEPKPVENVAATVSACSYTITETKPEWTAYKYTDKAAVNGTFNEFKLTQPEDDAPNTTFTEALDGLSITIDVASVESNNPARNLTIAEKFFGVFAVGETIKGNILSAKGDDEKGEMQINIDMNGVQKPYTFSYEQKDGAIVASSVMDMMDFNLGAPYESIHTTCKALHTGADGVAKTWTEVALRVVISYEKSCG